MTTSNETNGRAANIIAAAAVLLAVTMSLVAYVQSIASPLTSHQKFTEGQVLELSKIVGGVLTRELRSAEHIGTVNEKLRALEDKTLANGHSVAALDTDLQREMRDLDAAAEAKVDGLDARLQGEIRTVSGLLSATMEGNQRALEKNSEFQVMNRENIAGMSERLKALEREAPK